MYRSVGTTKTCSDGLPPLPYLSASPGAINEWNCPEDGHWIAAVVQNRTAPGPGVPRCKACEVDTTTRCVPCFYGDVAIGVPECDPSCQDQAGMAVRDTGVWGIRAGGMVAIALGLGFVLWKIGTGGLHIPPPPGGR